MKMWRKCWLITINSSRRSFNTKTRTRMASSPTTSSVGRSTMSSEVFVPHHRVSERSLSASSSILPSTTSSHPAPPRVHLCIKSPLWVLPRGFLKDPLIDCPGHTRAGARKTNRIYQQTFPAQHHWHSQRKRDATFGNLLLVESHSYPWLQETSGRRWTRSTTKLENP